MHVYEDYRHSGDMCGLKQVANPDLLYFHTVDQGNAQSVDYKQQDTTQYNGLFAGTIGNGRHYCVHNEVRAFKRSPVKPQSPMKPV